MFIRLIILFTAFIYFFFSCKTKEVQKVVEEIPEEVEVLEEDIETNREKKIATIVSRLDSIHRELDWRKLKHNLYINKNKEIGFQIPYATEVGVTVSYITHIAFEEKEISLHKIIDTVTFTHIGSTFYKDKNHIYHYYDMAYGGKFYIYNKADYSSFKVLGDNYAKDKNYIFGERAGILNHVDYKTFRTTKGSGPYAKDKNGYYFWDELIYTNKEIENVFGKKSISVKELSNLLRNNN